MAVKVKTKITHSGSDARKVAAAFREVSKNPPAIIAKTRRKSGASQAHKQEIAISLNKARAAGASIPGPSGANYVSRDDLHVPLGATQGWRRGGERVAPSGQASPGKNPSDLHNYPTHEQYVAHRFPDVHYGDAQVAHELEARTVEHVERPMNPTEQIRQNNNKARDFRTNLGRGKAGMPVIEEENNVTESR